MLVAHGDFKVGISDFSVSIKFSVFADQFQKSLMEVLMDWPVPGTLLLSLQLE